MNTMKLVKVVNDVYFPYNGTVFTIYTTNSINIIEEKLVQFLSQSDCKTLLKIVEKLQSIPVSNAFVTI